VCVHGAGVSSREFCPLVMALGRDHDAWTVDLPGYGRSGWTVDLPGHGRSGRPRVTVSLPALADALADWLKAVGLVDPCLLGVSYGCQITIDTALRYPDRVGSLVLVGPTADPAVRSLPRLTVRWLWNAMYENPRMLPLNIADYRDAGGRHVFTAFQESIRDRVEDKLPYVTQPTLVIRGAKDRIVPQEWAEEVTRLLPHGRLATVPNSPHMVPFRASDELGLIIQDFLRDHEGAG
jgi:pimeloyl-ACP methyl ester carboxylesterase